MNNLILAFAASLFTTWTVFSCSKPSNRVVPPKYDTLKPVETPEYMQLQARIRMAEINLAEIREPKKDSLAGGFVPHKPADVQYFLAMPQ